MSRSEKEAAHKQSQIVSDFEKVGFRMSDELREGLTNLAESEEFLRQQRRQDGFWLLASATTRVVGFLVVIGIGYGAYRLWWEHGWLGTSGCFLVWFLLGSLHVPAHGAGRR